MVYCIGTEAILRKVYVVEDDIFISYTKIATFSIFSQKNVSVNVLFV